MAKRKTPADKLLAAMKRTSKLATVEGMIPANRAEALVELEKLDGIYNHVWEIGCRVMRIMRASLVKPRRPRVKKIKGPDIPGILNEEEE